MTKTYFVVTQQLGCSLGIVFSYDPYAGLSYLSQGNTTPSFPSVNLQHTCSAAALATKSPSVLMLEHPHDLAA